MQILAPDAAQREAVRCRAGAIAGDSVWNGPGSAQQRFTLQRVQDKSTQE
ncbi:MAG: hypothetical protein JWR80_5637 [Bradyrhizobium sp.]|nr:hypothetical protein [Bradyrhizobium sp.]